MIFTTESQIVKNYVLLIRNNRMTYENVPDLYNLREAVQQCLEQ